MREKLLLAACWMIWPSSLLGSDSPADPLTTKQIVEGIIARSQAVFSGKIQYLQEFGFPGKKPERAECEIVFTVSSWRLSSKLDSAELPVVQTSSLKKAKIPIAPTSGTLELVKLSHHGKSVAYQHTPQPDGSMRDSAAITREKVIDNSFPSPPVFAGSFWFPRTSKFVQDNIGEARRMPAREVNGVTAEVLEWNVSDSNKFKAFNEINELTRNGGILRVFTSPQLGYALPRVEFLSPVPRVRRTWF